MRIIFSLFTSFCLALVFFISACGNGSDHSEQEIQDQLDTVQTLPDAKRQILVFSKTAGWRHESIEAGREALLKIGEENGIGVVASEDAGLFNNESLSRFNAVVFLNTTETIFNDDQRAALKSYIQNGGGFAGVHSATDTEYDWPWFGELIGARFDNHPPGIINADILVEDDGHPSTEMLPGVWNRDDEWYNFRGFEDHINVLLKLDTESFEGSDHPGHHPIAWHHEFNGGRIFYTALGHTIESYSEDLFLEHLWSGIESVMAD